MLWILLPQQWQLSLFSALFGMGLQDINFGQLVGGIKWLGYKIYAPLWILNWTQELQPDGLSWHRRSEAVFQNTSGGDYYWRAIVDGLGQPTKYFSKWLQAYDGRPFSYISNISPWCRFPDNAFLKASICQNFTCSAKLVGHFKMHFPLLPFPWIAKGYSI